MLFLLARVLAIVLPIFYFLVMKTLFLLANSWPWLFIAVVFINLVYFFVIYLKTKSGRVWLLFLYAVIFSSVGLLWALVLSNQLIINIFLIGWSLVYLIFLEASFNYLFQTKKIFFLEIRNVVDDFNAVVIFLLAAFLSNLVIFLNFSEWWSLLIYFVILFILLAVRFWLYDFSIKQNFIYTGVISLLVVEIMMVLFWWPTSAYVLAFIVAAFYYFFSSLATSFIQQKLSRNKVVKYFIFLILTLTLILTTAHWS